MQDRIIIIKKNIDIILVVLVPLKKIFSGRSLKLKLPEKYAPIILRYIRTQKNTKYWIKFLGSETQISTHKLKS